MVSGAYYNEIDPFAAQWLRNLIGAGHIAAGDVDERSIRDVHPVDLIGYTQCHFFAGIGVWSHALRRARWDDARPVWTGSCPCQPFSAAGKRTGTADDRHLWPEFFRLIGAHRPHVVFGEQVASKDGLSWLDAVQADLEGADYAFGALDLCAAGFGAPHIRQRLFFVADTDEQQRNRSRDAGTRRREQLADGRGMEHASCEQMGISGRPRQPRSAACEPAYADGRDSSAEGLQRSVEHGQQPQDGRAGGAVGYADDQGLEGRELLRTDSGGDGAGQCAARPTGAAGGFWSSCDWLPCIDGKARPVEPGTFPLAHGIAGRVGRLRAYGNAIVAPVAAEFIRAYIECRP